MRLMKTLAIATAAMVVTGASVHAQPAANAKPSSQAVALARQVVESLGGGANMSAVSESMIGPMMKAMPLNAKGDKMRQGFADFMREEIVKLQPRMTEVSVMSYAETFNERELVDILAFYRTDTGRAVSTRLPVMAGRTMALMAPIMLTLRSDVGERLCKLRACTPEQKATLRKGLGLAPASQN